MTEDVASKTSSNTESGAGTRSNLEKTLSSVMVAGRDILAKRKLVLPTRSDPVGALTDLCKQLINHRGEASGLALAGVITESYHQLEDAGRLAFFKALAEQFEVDGDSVLEAADAYREKKEIEGLWNLARLVEAPRQKLFRRINMAPDGTRTLVAMRGELLKVLRANPELKGVNSDFRHLFVSWFNKGFLELRRIDWSSPALVLDKIIAYEAVHEINGWDDLRSRLREDRRCFAFFHPALENEPLVFVEIALTDDTPGAIAPLLEQDRELPNLEKVTTVVFYSISNCQPGLAGVTFGNFLIKNVVEELKKELPKLKTFVTLSPIPGFRDWLQSADISKLVDEELAQKVIQPFSTEVDTEVSEALEKLCAHYLLREKSGGLARDPVARFHLGNGARLHRLNRDADLSAKGCEQSAGIMVNYLYDLPKIEIYHEDYFGKGRISASRTVSRLLS